MNQENENELDAGIEADNDEMDVGNDADNLIGTLMEEFTTSMNALQTQNLRQVEESYLKVSSIERVLSDSMGEDIEALLNLS